MNISKNNRQMDYIISLQKQLQEYKYGVLKNGQIQGMKSAQEWDKYYRYLSPKEFERYHGGACWDYVAYQTEKLTKEKIKFHNYYLEFLDDPDRGTHTITVCELGKDYIFMESSFKSIAGVYISDSLDNILDFVLTEMYKLNGGTFSKRHMIRRYKYMLNYGATCEEFMYRMYCNEVVRDDAPTFREITIGGGIVKKNTESYYRVTYNGVGIYEAFRQLVPQNVWFRFLKSEHATWLPKPPEYTNGYKSYFTQLGYAKFKQMTLPFMKRYLNGSKINVKKCDISERIVYRDQYQVVTDEVYGVSTNAMTEGYLINEKDIYYNKDKFDSGEINLCFITGHSGSGKSTMGNNMQKDNVEHYDLDDVVANKMHFTMANLKEYGDLIYSFFSGPGKKYFYTAEDVKSGKVKEINGLYEKQLIDEFITYVKMYAASDKTKKFVIEGIWLYEFVEPSRLKDYAVYIKGTSALISTIRAASRDSKEEYPDKKDKVKRFKSWWGRFKVLFCGGIGSKSNGFAIERKIKKYRQYFSKLEKDKPVTESKKCDKNLKFMDISNPNAKKYLLQDSGCKKFIKFYLESNVGELIFDADNDVLVGTIFVRTDKGQEGFIHSLWINKEYRGYGLSHKLVKDAITKYHGCDLTVLKDNNIAINLYKKHGFIMDHSKDTKDMYYMILKSHLKDNPITEYTIKSDTEYFMKLDKSKAVTESKKCDNIDNRKFKLSSLKKVKITKQLCDKLSKNYPRVKHLRINSNTNGFFFMKNSENLVLTIVVETKNNDEKWIQALEVEPEFRGHNLGNQLLDFAINQMDARFLSVRKTNKIAISLYKKHGFKIYDETDSMYFMKLDKK